MSVQDLIRQTPPIVNITHENDLKRHYPDESIKVKIIIINHNNKQIVILLSYHIKAFKKSLPNYVYLLI